MSVNDRDSYDGPHYEDVGLSICKECDAEESANCERCNGNGWLLLERAVPLRVINKQFELLYSLRVRWDKRNRGHSER